MAFRKRNIGISRLSDPSAPSNPDNTNAPTAPTKPSPVSLPGVRPSPVDGRPTTSTGVSSLDALLAGHAGLALGSCVLVEENGTTDFAGIMLRYYAAEGLVQGHKVHVVGVGEQWGRDLPAVIGVAGGDEAAGSRREGGKEKERMKIAWRYERLGEFGAAPASRGPSPVPDRTAAAAQAAPGSDSAVPAAFCHMFDLTKKLAIPAVASINYIPLAPPNRAGSPFASILDNLSHQLATSPPNTVHRLVIPTLLSPLFYPTDASQPHYLLQFFHGLRGLLRKHAGRFTAITSLPLELYPRSTGLVRWLELLSDGVIELTPFPHLMDAYFSLASSGAATSQEERPQGMFKIHRLPVYHERGGGGGAQSGLGDDLAFTVSRKRFVIKPFSLPPMEGDTEAQQGNTDGKPSKAELAF